MTGVILEWKASDWKYVREYLGLTTSDVYEETGIDQYDVENHIQTAQVDKSRLAAYYNRLLAYRHDYIRMSRTPPKRWDTRKKSREVEK